MEFKADFPKELKLGDTVTVSDLSEGVEWVDVTGISKGKGFQGVVKRHGFGGVGGATHGQADRLRHPGSMGASSWPSRVFKGMRMAGRWFYGCILLAFKSIQGYENGRPHGR